MATGRSAAVGVAVGVAVAALVAGGLALRGGDDGPRRPGEPAFYERLAEYTDCAQLATLIPQLSADIGDAADAQERAVLVSYKDAVEDRLLELKCTT
jgi:hypothetical protein